MWRVHSYVNSAADPVRVIRDEIEMLRFVTDLIAEGYAIKQDTLFGWIAAQKGDLTVHIVVAKEER